MVNSTSRESLLKNLLCAHWLKPESALFYAHELWAVRKLLGDNITQLSLDFGCLDGVNTFILLGGEFGLQFDSYLEVTWEKDAHKEIEHDYFNSYHHYQVITPDIKIKPKDYFEIGLDWKEAHLKKANRLGIYRQVTQQSLNAPLARFEDQTFTTIWAPMLFWVDNLESTLKEMRRVLEPEGRIVTIFPDTSQLQYCFYLFSNKVDPTWIETLDRGKYNHYALNAHTFIEWEKIFKLCGLHIAQHEPFLPSLVSQVYDIGLRPMFPVFMNMYEKLKNHSIADFLDLKQHWIDTAFHFLSPLCETEWMEKMRLEYVWHAFELKCL